MESYGAYLQYACISMYACISLSERVQMPHELKDPVTLIHSVETKYHLACLQLRSESKLQGWLRWFVPQICNVATQTKIRRRSNTWSTSVRTEQLWQRQMSANLSQSGQKLTRNGWTSDTGFKCRSFAYSFNFWALIWVSRLVDSIICIAAQIPAWKKVSYCRALQSSTFFDLLPYLLQCAWHWIWIRGSFEV